MTRQNLDALTGLRATAAAIILIGHMRGTVGVPSDFLSAFQTENGVTFFFVLSGFILTYAHQGEISAGERKRFYLARFARVWPLHIAGILAIYLFVGSPTLLGTYDTLPVGILNLLLLQSWVPTYQVFLSYNPVSWSLSVEAFFYALFPFIHVRRVSGALFWLAISVGLIVALILLSKASGSNPFVWGVESINVAGFMYVNPAARLLEFVVGAIVCRYWLSGRLASGYTARHVNVRQVVAVLSVVASFALAKIIGNAVLGSGALEVGQWLNTSGVTMLPTAFLIYTFAEGRGVLGGILASRPAVYLGRISFAVYIFHQTPLHYYNRHTNWLSEFDGFVGISIYLLFVLVAASLLHFAIEEPCRRWLTGRR